MTPKESYCVLHYSWTTKSVVHIYGHSWLTRCGHSWEREHSKVNSNYPELKLFLDGKSQGRRPLAS